MLVDRCYPTISDWIFHSTGFDLPLPVFSFGFFVAMAFLSAAAVLKYRLRQLEQAGYVKPFPQMVIQGARATPYELLSSGIMGFLLGFKGVYVALNYPVFAKNPQTFILSGDGEWLWGILLSLGMAFLKYREKEKEKLPTPKKETVWVHPYNYVAEITTVAAIAGISGAKLFYLFESPGNLKEFLNDPLGSFFGGLTIYGGLILGAIAVSLFVQRKGIAAPVIADAAAPSLFLAYGIGRIGCHVSGDGDWGIVNQLPKPNWIPQKLWAFDYPHNIINEGIPITDCIEKHCYVLEQAVFPTPLYETTLAFLFFGLLMYLAPRIKASGVLFSIYLMLNGTERFFIEKIRVNTEFQFLWFKATQAEVVAVLFFLAGCAGLWYFSRQYRFQRKAKF